MRFIPLFTPGKIGGMTVKNRLVMPPMVRNYATTSGLATPRYIDHITAIARGGVGLMILEASYINPDGKGFSHQLGIHNDATIPGLKRLAKAAHKNGAKIGIQLYHAGRQTSPATIGTQPLAPSPIPDPTIGAIPKAMELRDITACVADFKAAAIRAKKAGLDFVEIHGAHGYLITQFLSPYSNKRKDAYGGTFEKRLRFLDEVYQAVREGVGEAFPIIVRLSADELVKGGLVIEDTKKIARHLEDLGANALHITAGNYASYEQGLMISPMAVEDGPLVKFASQVKNSVHIPVITVDKIRTPEMAQSIIQRNLADFVAMGRTLLADPEWPNKIREDRENEITPCISCNQGCISRLFQGQDVWCTANPACGREKEFSKARKTVKTVIVVGGGPAGLKAAKVAAARGCRVILYERSKVLGGQLLAAAAAPHREEWDRLRKSLIRDVTVAGVEIKLGESFTSEDATRSNADVVILATGSAPNKPNFPGSDTTNVVFAREIMEGKTQVSGSILVAGGGCMGAQTAEHLARSGHQVTVVEAAQSIAVDAPTDDRALLLRRLKDLKVGLLTHTKLLSIENQNAFVSQAGKKRKLKADTVVICFGSHPLRDLQSQLKGKVKKVITVGDAKEVRRVTEAVLEGALAGLKV